MKFGNNLNNLSIKGWKNYNLNYNHLKKLIRDDNDLKVLNQAFIENFDYINLFIKCKYQELNDKLVYLQSLLNKVNDDSYKLDIINYELYQLFQEILLLSKFLILQKVATRKIFKKLLKYYKHREKADKLVTNLTNYLIKDDWSYINLDLFQLNQLFTIILSSIKKKQHRERDNSVVSLTHDLLPTKSSTNLANMDFNGRAEFKRFSSRSFSDDGDYLCSDTRNMNHQRKPSFQTTVSSNQAANVQPLSLAFNSLFASNLHPQQSPTSNESSFDLLILLKKNFQLSFLSPPDLLQDLTLNLNLSFQSINSDSDNLISYIFLCNKNLSEPPSFIVSQSSQTNSLIITYIGGLRKYSYCLLPNKIVEYLLKYLNHDTEVKSLLYNYFIESSISLLTRTTIDTILSKNLEPKLKLICNRERYVLNNQMGDEDDEEMITCNDDYMILLDYNIYTSNKYVYDLNFATQEYEIFPHNIINIYTNDFNLSNFEGSLESTIYDNHINNSYNQYYLGQLPSKIQKLIEKNNNLSMFKNLRVYSYMTSCYFNKIDKEYINNHYSNLLQLNLLKNWENADNFNHQLEIETSLIQKRSEKIIKRQMSRDFDLNYSTPLKSSNKSNLPSIGSTITIPSIFDKTSYLDNPYTIYYSEDEELFYEYDDYSIFLNLMTSTSILGGFILNFIKLKNKIGIKLNKFKIKEPTIYYTKPKPTFQLNSPLLDNYNYNYNSNSNSNSNLDNYDSINDEEPQFLDRHELELQYESDYDLSLSYLYFACTIVANFLSGIELGIIYSFIYLTEEDSKNLLSNNLWLVLIVIFGLLLSMILSLISINLSFLRFHNPPIFHYLILLIGFTVVLNCCIWSGVIFYSC